MPKKTTNARANRVKAPVTRSTPVRNTPVPKIAEVNTNKLSRAISHEMIAERAYLISISSNGGSQDENWHRAERELRAGL